MGCYFNINAILLFLALIVFGNCTIPDYIHVCHHDDPDLANCIKESVEALRPRLATGISELEVPSIEPFKLDIVSFNTSSGTTYLKTNITNIQVWGASNFSIIKIVPTLTKNGHTFRFEVIIPHLRIQGDYEIDARILLLELKGKGPFNANATDFHFECIMKGEKIQREGVNHLEFEKMKCNAVLKKATILLENLFNGNPVLGKATNEAINDNSEAFFEEIKPSLLSALRQKFTDIANKITLYFKYEELFP